MSKFEQCCAFANHRGVAAIFGPDSQCKCEPLFVGAPSKRQTELANLSAKDAVDQLCSGQITALDYTQALLEQIELHACLNNFAALQPDKVLLL